MMALVGPPEDRDLWTCTANLSPQIVILSTDIIQKQPDSKVHIILHAYREGTFILHSLLNIMSPIVTITNVAFSRVLFDCDYVWDLQLT